MFIQRPDGSRQILQCVGQIRTGSLVHTLNQVSDSRRHGNLHGAMPTLLLSPSSRSQWSGASSIGNHSLGMESSRVCPAGRPTYHTSERPSWKAVVWADHAHPGVQDRRSLHAETAQRSIRLGSACDECRDAPFETGDLPDRLISFGPGRKTICGFPQALQQLHEFAQFSTGYSNYALAHAVASSLE